MINRIFIVIQFLSISFLVTGCLFSYNKELINGYSLWAADTMDDSALMILTDEYQVGVVSARITAYTYNENYIAVIQENTTQEHQANDEKRYFIIPFKNRISELPEKNVIGPLKTQEFNKIIKRLNGHTDIKFSKVE